MTFIPKEHENYDILPLSRKHGGEVFEYDSRLLTEIQEKAEGFPDPYGYSSYEAYYKVIDDFIAKRPVIKELLESFKLKLEIQNDKSKWGIVRYNGESNMSFTKGRFYYVPIYELDGKLIVSGIIDDEEYTSYCDWDFSGKQIDTTELENGDIMMNQEIKFSIPEFEIVVNLGGL